MNIKKIIRKCSIFSIECLILFNFIFVTFAAVPESNRMKLGEVSSNLPVEEVQDYYAKMEPLMLKYFGPPFSDFSINIIAKPEVTNESVEVNPKDHTLYLYSVAKNFFEDKDKGDVEHAMSNLFGFLKHELSHAMYFIDGNDAVNFLGNNKWFSEGWANVLAEIMDNQIDGTTRSASLYYETYVDKDTVKGTEESTLKQNATHSLEYSFATSANLTLLSAASSSNDNLDFYKKLNGTIYDFLQSKASNDLLDNKERNLNDVKAGLKPLGRYNLSFDEYKNLIKPLLTGVKIDGIDAYDWYINSPIFYNGSLGPHIGAYLVSSKENFGIVRIEAFAFNRIQDGRQIKEIPIEGLNINIQMSNSKGKIVLEKKITTDKNGDAIIQLRDNPEINLETGAYLIQSEAEIGGKTLKNKMFALVPPPTAIKKEYLYGVLLDENQNLINGDGVTLLKSDDDFLYRKNGLFIIDVPETKRIENLNFLGLEQEVTKGPFARVFALTVPADYLKEMERTMPTSVIDNEIDTISKTINNSEKNGNNISNQQEDLQSADSELIKQDNNLSTIIIIVLSIIVISFILVLIIKNNKKEKAKNR